MKILCISALFATVSSKKIDNFFNDTTLQPLQVPLAIFDNKTFMTTKKTILFLQSKVMPDNQDLIVTDYLSKKPVFKISNPFNTTTGLNFRTLKFLNGSEICTLKTNFTLYARQNLFNSYGKEVSRIYQKFSLFRVKLSFMVTNLRTRRLLYVYLVRDRKNNGAYISMETEHGSPQVIGRIQFGPTETKFKNKDRDLIISINKGVDLAFMVMVAASYDSTYDRFILPNYRGSMTPTI